MGQARTYLDHNATSPLRPEALAAVREALELCGNASSVHAEGRRARDLVERAREEVASLLSAPRSGIVFTSGGTEANNLAILGAPADRIAVSGIEHDSVLEPARRSGRRVDVLAVDGNGIVDLLGLDRRLADGAGRTLVSIMLANNETGVVEPIADVVNIAHRHGALVHTDAVQAVGKVPVSFAEPGVDLMTVSAHKFGGPVGAGALIVRDGLALKPLITGGGQELRRRAGTENVAAIAGFGAAASAAGDHAVRMAGLRDRLEDDLAGLAPGAHIFAAGAERLPNTTCFAIPGVEADLLLMGLDLEGVAVSSGAACSSGKVERSHVLAAMGMADALAGGAIRVSFGWNSTREDVSSFIAALEHVLDRAGFRAAA